jgi:hypothetical protein
VPGKEEVRTRYIPSSGHNLGVQQKFMISFRSKSNR